MLLNPILRSQLVGTARATNPGGVIDDACELLTGQIVLWLKARQRTLGEKRAALPLGDPEANVVAAQMRTLGEAIVALAEAP
jgi:hypothetical protein